MRSPIQLQAVILTGRRANHNPLLQGTTLQSKVMLPVGGQPMVLSVLEQIAQLQPVPPIWISTQDPAIQALPTPIPFQTMPNEASAVQSFMKALELLPESEWVLLASGDHPLLTTEMLSYFIEKGMALNAALVVAVVEQQTVQASYPQSQRTYFKAKDGAFSGGNLFLVNRHRFRPDIHFMETIDRNRKKPWKSAFLLNPLEILQIAFRQLTMRQVAERASRVLGCKADVVIMPFAECCMDVDKPSDKAIAEQILAKRQANPTLTSIHQEPCVS